MSKFFVMNVGKLEGKMNPMPFEWNSFTLYFPIARESFLEICSYQTKERNDFPFPNAKIREPNETLVLDHLLTHSCKNQFFAAGYQAWVSKNSDQSHTSIFLDGISRARYFLVTLWLIWKEKYACFNATPFVVAKVLCQARMLAWDLQLTVESFNRLSLDLVNGRWFAPPPVYCKLNSKLNIDGSVRDGKATYGGLLCNDTGAWVWGFNGCCNFTSLFAELKALEQGQWLLHQRDCMLVIKEIACLLLLSPTLPKRCGWLMGIRTVITHFYL
ncbi:hypothetical protein LguiA_031409 [Lonicera macranthoides]